MIRSIFLSIIILFSIQSVVHSFDLKSIEERSRLEHQFLIKDLTVGDSIKVDDDSICRSNGKLAILDLNGDKKSKYQPEYIITIGPGRTATLKINPKENNKDDLNKLLLNRYNCQLFNKLLFNNKAKLIMIDSVNGFDNEEDYIADLIKKGFILKKNKKEDD